MSRLDGLSALVAGGAASIGLATSIALARDGANVLITGLDAGQLTSAADAVRAAAPGATIATAVADSTDEAAVARAVAAACALPGRFGICVSAVGQTTMAPLLHYTPAEWWAEIDRNIVSAFLALKHAGAALRERGGGSFVAVSSHAAVRTMRYLGSYCTAKAGLEMMLRVAADELGSAGVRVNVVRPGLTRREQSSPIFGDDALEHAYLVRTPLGRHGTPDDSAQVIRFLAGPESSWMTGQCLTVDGGLELRGAPDLREAAVRTRGAALFDAEQRSDRGAPPARAGRLDGQTALVTGGGSSIGLASARLLARDGADVLICGRSAERLREAAAQLATEGVPVRHLAADVTDEASIAGAAEAAAAPTGTLDICVASAGAAIMSPLLDCDLDRFREPFGLNVIGSYLTLKHAARLMAAGGSFVAISSESAVASIRGLGAYCASKAALDMLVRVAADELGGSGIRVNGVRPGLTRREAESPIFGDEVMMQRYREQTPLVRSGVADDCAFAVRYFAGTESAWTTGQCLTVDGGLELRGAPDLLGITERFQTVIEQRPPEPR